MSPEQAKGRAVDRRADIWAFGVVLYEMLTGLRLFKGDDVAEVMASVLQDRAGLDGAACRDSCVRPAAVATVPGKRSAKTAFVDRRCATGARRRRQCRERHAVTRLDDEPPVAGDRRSGDRCRRRRNRCGHQTGPHQPAASRASPSSARRASRCTPTRRWWRFRRMAARWRSWTARLRAWITSSGCARWIRRFPGASRTPLRRSCRSFRPTAGGWASSPTIGCGLCPCPAAVPRPSVMSNPCAARHGIPTTSFSSESMTARC